jgi:aspartyl-tRNA(Asn)/glutamyl-tRNA(Gln) amidotransferase subunit A
MCLGALGSQTGGSITRPASYCGVAGYKPSYGMLSCHGVVPLAPSMDHPGPIGRCVRDLAMMLQVLWQAVTAEPPVAYEQQCDATDAPTLYRPLGLFRDSAFPSVRAAMDEVCGSLSKRGATVRDVGLPASFSEVITRHRTVMAVEAAQFHGKRLARHPEDYQPRIRALLEEGLACSGPEYAECKEHQQRLTFDMNSLGSDEIVLITPATTSPAPDASSTGDPAFNSPWSYTGLPTLSIPTGQFVEGLPLAIQLVLTNRRDREAAGLFRAAAWVEKALGVGPLTPPLPR